MNRQQGYVPLKLGQREFMLRYNMNALCRLQEEVGADTIQDLMQLLRHFDLQKINFLQARALLWAGLLHQMPTLKPGEAGDLVQLPGEIIIAFTACIEAVQLILIAPADPDAPKADADHPPKPDLSTGQT